MVSLKLNTNKYEPTIYPKDLQSWLQVFSYCLAGPIDIEKITTSTSTSLPEQGSDTKSSTHNTWKNSINTYFNWYNSTRLWPLSSVLPIKSFYKQPSRFMHSAYKKNQKKKIKGKDKPKRDFLFQAVTKKKGE